MAELRPVRKPARPHDDHDFLLIAARATDELAGAEIERADALILSCAECTELLADLRAIRTATSSVAAPTRPRDFRLSAHDAERLQPRGIRGWLGWTGGRRLQLGRPFAAGLTALGLAGLLVTTLPSGGPAASPGAAIDAAASPASSPAAAAGAPTAAAAPAGGQEATVLPASSPGDGDIFVTEASGAPRDRTGATQGTTGGSTPPPVIEAERLAAETPTDRVRATVAVASVVMVTAGIALWLAIGWRRRRRA